MKRLLGMILTVALVAVGSGSLSASVPKQKAESAYYATCVGQTVEVAVVNPVAVSMPYVRTTPEGDVSLVVVNHAIPVTDFMHKPLATRCIGTPAKGFTYILKPPLLVLKSRYARHWC